MPGCNVYRFSLTQPGNQQVRIEIFRGAPGTEASVISENRLIECDPAALNLDVPWLVGFDKFFIGAPKTESFKCKVDFTRIPDALSGIITDFSKEWSTGGYIGYTTVWVVKKYISSEWRTYFVGVQKVGVLAEFKPGAIDNLIEFEIFDVKRDMLEQISFKALTKWMLQYHNYYSGDYVLEMFDYYLTDGTIVKGQKYFILPKTAYYVYTLDSIFISIAQMMTAMARDDGGVAGNNSLYGLKDYVVPSSVPIGGNWFIVSNPYANWRFFKQQTTYSAANTTNYVGDNLSTSQLLTTLFVTNAPLTSGMTVDEKFDKIIGGLWIGKDSLETKYPDGIYEWLMKEYRGNLCTTMLYRHGWNRFDNIPISGADTYTVTQDLWDADRGVTVMDGYINEARVALQAGASLYGNSFSSSNQRVRIGENIEVSTTFHNLPADLPEDDSAKQGAGFAANTYYQGTTKFPAGLLFYEVGGSYYRVHERCYQSTDLSGKTSEAIIPAVAVNRNSSWTNNDFRFLSVTVREYHGTSNHIAQVLMKMFGVPMMSKITMKIPTDAQRSTGAEGVYPGMVISYDREAFMDGQYRFVLMPDKLLCISIEENLAKNTLNCVFVPQLYTGA